MYLLPSKLVIYCISVRYGALYPVGDVTVATCLKAGVTHELMIESDSDKSCDADTGILTVVVEGTVSHFTN